MNHNNCRRYEVKFSKLLIGHTRLTYGHFMTRNDQQLMCTNAPNGGTPGKKQYSKQYKKRYWEWTVEREKVMRFIRIKEYLRKYRNNLR